ncbi:MAG: FAD-dependent oxidoreductase [Actinomycetota bacterium]
MSPLNSVQIDRRSFLALGAIVLAGCASRTPGTSGAATNEQADTSTGAAGQDAPLAEDRVRDVIVVGAGPAGMTAAYRLRRMGVDVEVLEAGRSHGGRIKHDLEFTEFPIPLGAEWVHVDGQILDEIVDDEAVDVGTELRGYAPDAEVAIVDGTSVSYLPNTLIFDGDLKFVGSSWLDFFNTYVVPEIADRLVYETQVTAIDYGDEIVRVTDATGTVRQANKVLVTVPLKLLQRRDIDFQPPFTDERIDTIDGATVWSGLKAFFEFEDAFYPATIALEDSDTPDGQRIFYDAAYGQNSDVNVLGLFSVGAQAERYQALSHDELAADVLDELDRAFDGAAGRSYVRHIVQNWNDEPFAGAAYLADGAAGATTRLLAQSIDDRLYFAGDAYTSFDDWSSVHAAARSAADAVAEIMA